MDKLNNCRLSNNRFIDGDLFKNINFQDFYSISLSRISCLINNIYNIFREKKFDWKKVREIIQKRDYFPPAHFPRKNADFIYTLEKYNRPDTVVRAKHPQRNKR